MASNQNLLLIPGLVCDAAVWRHQVAHLADIAEISVPPVTQGETIAEMARVVRRPEGRIVLAEFDTEGFAIVARVHTAEGHTHGVGPITFDAAVNDFRSRGFLLRSMADAHAHRVAILTVT